jgi:hypothetical protein
VFVAALVLSDGLVTRLPVRGEPWQDLIQWTQSALNGFYPFVRLDTLSSVVFKFSAPLPFMFAGAWSPFTDLHGGELQKGYADEILEQIFVSSFARDSSATICVSWRNIDDAPGHIIADQLLALPDDQRASACLQFVMKHVENVFFNPDWFQTLNDKQKERLNQLAADGLETMPRCPSISRSRH